MGLGTMNREPISDVSIRFQDCDPFGHLNNARYIDYFINAREDHLAAHYDLDIYERQKKTRTNWIVAKTKIAYLSPAVYRETVSIRTRLIRHTATSLLMEGVMLDRTRTALKALVWIEFRHFDLANGKIAAHTDELTELFDAIAVRDVETGRFDARVREIIRQQRKEPA